ncbi:hypothetical protein WMY93_033702 [Mugilogobius chulae]|uniref:Uncharacterized protein n=1 Tax=Mugilogobius chulae TaxID=88201 RepID=A0AAW0MR61_9GOBI
MATPSTNNSATANNGSSSGGGNGSGPGSGLLLHQPQLQPQLQPPPRVTTVSSLQESNTCWRCQSETGFQINLSGAPPSKRTSAARV